MAGRARRVDSEERAHPEAKVCAGQPESGEEPVVRARCACGEDGIDLPELPVVGAHRRDPVAVTHDLDHRRGDDLDSAGAQPPYHGRVEVTDTRREEGDVLGPLPYQLHLVQRRG